MDAAKKEKLKIGAIILALIAAIAFPFVAPNEYFVYVMALAFATTISGIGFNLIFGYTGQLNLAHAGIYTLGAYAVGLLTVDYQVPYWLAFVAAIVITSLFGLLAGLVSLRLQGHYFAIFTLCIGMIIYLLIEKSVGFTHGTLGVIDIPPPGAIGPLKFEGQLAQYFLALAFLIGALWLMKRITSSLMGRAFVAIRTSEELAQAIGVDLMRTKVLALVISCAYAGFAGGLYAGLVRFLDPSLANTNYNFQLLGFVLIGGAGTLFGPVVGILLMTWVMQMLGPLQEHSLLIYGPVLIVLVIYFPRGLVGLLSLRQAKASTHA